MIEFFTRDKELTQKAVTDKIRPVEIANFLSDILAAIRDCKNVGLLERKLFLFRKWKIWLLNNLGIAFSEDVQTSTDAFDENRTNQVTTVRLLASAPEEPELMRALTERVDPVHGDHQHIIEAFDAAFFAKHNAYQLLISGDSEFKRGELLKAHNCFIEVVELLLSNEALDNLQLYFLAWATHSLGNLAFVRGDFRGGANLFRISVRIKEPLPIPKVNVWASKLKFQYLHFRTEATVNSANELWSAHKYFARQHSFRDQNAVWYDNLRNDMMYYSGLVALRMGQHDRALMLSRKSLKLGEKISDKIGIVRAVTMLRFIHDKSEQVANATLTRVIGSMNAGERRRPYLLTAIHEVYQAQGSQRQDVKNKLTSLFSELGIDGPDARHIDYGPRKLKEYSFSITGGTKHSQKFKFKT